MAVDDIIRWKNISLANDGTEDFKPSDSNIASATEAILQNIYWPNGSAVELYVVNGADVALFRPQTKIGSFEHLDYNVDETQFIRLKNKSGAAINVFADGRQTK